MDTLRIHIHIHSRYQVFDASCKLPFSIVFGLCRRSPADTDRRPLILETAGSALDVPYALAHDLLSLEEQEPNDSTQWRQVDSSNLLKFPKKDAECISLPSPVTRTKSWREEFTVYQCQLDANGPITSLLQHGKRYRIRLASEDLGVKRWAYSDQPQFSIDNEGLNPEAKLVNSKPTGGNASFKVVAELTWPPKIETRMRLCGASSLTSGCVPTSAALEVAVTNTGSNSVSVQTRGHQQFLTPWGPFQPEEYQDDSIRIIDANPSVSPTSSLQVFDSMTGKVVRETKQTGIEPLMDLNADRRLKIQNLVVLRPGEPIIRRVSIARLVAGLQDGFYVIKMKPTGCRWWEREIREVDGDDGRVPDGLGRKFGIPLVLETADEVGIHVRDGRVEQSS